MSEAVMIESTSTAEQQAAAEAIGWIPPSRFKGDVEKFIDAAEYIERGEKVLPIVQATNKRLTAELTQLRNTQASQAAALAAAQKALEEIDLRNSVATQKAVERATAQVKAELAAASEAGDHKGVAELTDQLVELKDAAKDAKAAAERKEAPPAVEAAQPDPALLQWVADNPWFNKDRRKTAYAMGVAQELRDAQSPLRGAEFYAAVAAEVNKQFAPEPQSDKVEGARNGTSGEGSRSSRGKSYASLPAEAKAACDADARNFVGKGKRYETVEAWRARYAELYFQE